MTGSAVTGNVLGSSELLIEPGDDQVTDIQMDVGSAGSISLIIQAALLAAKNYKVPFTLDLKGGTNVMWAPPIDNYPLVLFPMMKRMGIDVSCEILERGFYPIGGGHARVVQQPIGRIKPLILDSLGELKRIKGLCFVQHLSDRTVSEMTEACDYVFKDKYPLEMEIERTTGASRGAGVVLVAEYENGLLSSNVLSNKGHSPKQTGLDVASDLLQEMRSGSTMDIHTADQILPYMAMAEGQSRFSVSRISKHLLSQMDTLESFLDVKFGVERKNDIYHFTVNPGGSARWPDRSSM